METSSNIEIAEEMMSVAKVTRLTFAALILYIRQHQPKRERQRAWLAWRNALIFSAGGQGAEHLGPRTSRVYEVKPRCK